MDWKHLFEPHILKRGLAYYEEGLVKKYKEGEDFIEATVHGSSDYVVYIRLKGDDIFGMDCNCPHAQSGNRCKHMAAVLFRMEKEAPSKTKQPLSDLPVALEERATSQKEARELVQQADEAAVRNFLANLLEGSDWLTEEFKNMLRSTPTAESMKRYKAHITSIFRGYRDQDGFIDYRMTMGLTDELYQFIQNDIRTMVERGYHKEAFNLTAFIVGKMGRQDMDDSDGGKHLISGTCEELWRDLLGRCGSDVKKTMYKWFKTQLGEPDVECIGDAIEGILFDCFHETEFLKDKRDFCEGKIEEYKKEKDSWRRDDSMGKWVVHSMEVMREMNASQEEIDRYAKDHMELIAVREWYADDCIKRK